MENDKPIEPRPDNIWIVLFIEAIRDDAGEKWTYEKPTTKAALTTQSDVDAYKALYPVDKYQHSGNDDNFSCFISPPEYNTEPRARSWIIEIRPVGIWYEPTE